MDIRMDSRADYRITVCGIGDESWFEFGIRDIRLVSGPTPCSEMTLNADQAGLMGFLKTLYNRGIPILSVCVLE